MEIAFPDVPEYHFILKGLCSEKFATYPKFYCEAISQFKEQLDADIVFAPAPVAMLNSHNYSFMKTGNIFSYFSGPVILSPQEEKKEIYVRERDFVSKYYAKILLKDTNVILGEGFPAMLEPRIALLIGESQYEKYDLYDNWGRVTSNLPFPLYSGLIRNSMRDIKNIVEEAINSSIKYALDNSSTIIKDIATVFNTENVEMLKRAIFHFINKNTLTISDEEIESLKALNNEMKNLGYSVSKIRF